MKSKKHTSENVGSKSRDQSSARRRHPLLQAHRNWRVWVVAALMIGLILVYVITDNLSLRPGNPPSQPMPEMSGP